MSHGSSGSVSSSPPLISASALLAKPPRSSPARAKNRPKESSGGPRRFIEDSSSPPDRTETRGASSRGLGGGAKRLVAPPDRGARPAWQTIPYRSRGPFARRCARVRGARVRPVRSAPGSHRFATSVSTYALRRVERDRRCRSTDGGCSSGRIHRKRTGMERTGSLRQASLSVGTAVEVRNEFAASWRGGFEIAAATPAGYRVRRVSDRYVLPADFGPQRLRRAG